jgi:putative DNA methylase
MTQYRKKLIEVALPLEAINVASAREKSIRHGHPSTLHLWWARRPLAACRAVLFASLVDDPDSDPAYAQYDAETREHMAGEKRQQLFDLITELVQWENSNNELVINAARAEIARCVASRKIETGELKKDHTLPGGETVYDLVVKGHGDLGKLRKNVVRLPKAESVNAFLAKHAPPVLDPFCGGGSIPLEAQRLGLRAYGSDLNPVPVLITKALIEIPPKFANLPPMNPESRDEAGPAGKKGKGKGKSVLGQSEWRGAQGLAEDVRYYGEWMRGEAEKRIGNFYPKVKVTAEMVKDRPDLKPYVGEELTVIAWLWTRTVASPNPAARGAHVPLVRTFYLCTKKGKEVWARPVLDNTPEGWHFEVGVGQAPAGFDPSEGTIGRKGGRCILTGVPMNFPHVRTEGQAGRMKKRLMAIVAEGKRGRVYFSPIDDHVRAAASAAPSWKPDFELPHNPRDFKTPNYGMKTFADLFTNRQLMALVTFSDLVSDARAKALADARDRGALPHDDRSLEQGGAGLEAYADSVATYLAFGVSRGADAWSTITSWRNGVEATRGTFARQALPMVWDFAEANPFSQACGNWEDASIEWITKVIANSPIAAATGSVRQLDATAVLNAVESPVISTDPPYYDNIGYADLSDFFYVWLRKTLSRIHPTIFATVLTPKNQELVATPYRHRGSRDAAQAFFEEGLGQSFDRMRQALPEDYPLTVYYAFKQAETEDADEDGEDFAEATASTGWETMLTGLIRAKFRVIGTWPVRTERGARAIGIGSNALASSIVLTCRARSDEAPLATRREFLNALKRELPDALKHLQRGNIAPVDLAQAAIGPGMAVFTRYAKVMEADGSPMKVRQALAMINQMLDEVLAEQEGEFDADTRWALAWFEQFSTTEDAFGVADVLARAKNTAVNALVEAGIVHARGGKVRLLKRDELPVDWNPATDNKVRHWEVAQHLIHALETGGETAAANLLRRVGGMGEVARDLAYRLYNICERKGWASEALAYNGLVIAWPEINKLSQQAPVVAAGGQGQMF